jgi:hypothetical protein
MRVARIYTALQKYWKKSLILFFLGSGLSFLINRNIHKLNNSGGVFLNDMLFITAMVFILFGLAELVSNIGFFNSMVFGTKCLYRLITKKLKSSALVKDEYIEFVNSRGKYSDVTLLLFTGLGLLILSLLPFPVGIFV